LGSIRSAPARIERTIEAFAGVPGERLVAAADGAATNNRATIIARLTEVTQSHELKLAEFSL